MAITTINDLNTALNTGARSNLFKVTLTGKNMSVDENSTFSYLCKAAQLPGSTLGIIEVPFAAGRRFKAAGDRTFAPWSVTVYNDTNFKLRNAFERWQNGINNMSDNEGLTNPADYQVDAFIDHLDRNGNTVKSYTLRGAFPLDVQAIELTYDEQTAIEQFTVSFAYQFFESGTTT